MREDLATMADLYGDPEGNRVEIARREQIRDEINLWVEAVTR